MVKSRIEEIIQDEKIAPEEKLRLIKEEEERIKKELEKELKEKEEELKKIKAEAEKRIKEIKSLEEETEKEAEDEKIKKEKGLEEKVAKEKILDEESEGGEGPLNELYKNQPLEYRTERIKDQLSLIDDKINLLTKTYLPYEEQVSVKRDIYQGLRNVIEEVKKNPVTESYVVNKLQSEAERIREKSQVLNEDGFNYMLRINFLIGAINQYINK